MRVRNLLQRLAILPSLAIAALMVSCGTITEDTSNCTLVCNIKFKYDMNMKFADAFANSVDYVTLCVYDAETGKLVTRMVDSGEALAQEDYVMTLDNLTAGTYDLVAWCGDGLMNNNFMVPQPTANISHITELNCTMAREENNTVKEDVGQLFHGMKRITIEGKYGVRKETISLTKDTNVVRVILQHLSGIDVDKDLFRFEITDKNGALKYDNSLLSEEVITYYPWSVTSGSAGVGEGDIYDATRTQTSVSVALAEFTVNRLLVDNNPILSVYNTTNDKLVLSIPLKDYALLVKGYYNRNMSNQEYLDRQDEYNLTFFLDEFGNWAAGVVIINSWSVVINDTDL